jgi:hypothetical protein
MNAWTQPKDAFTRKIEEIQSACNLYSEDLFQHERVQTDIAFLPSDQHCFLRDYEDDHFQHLILQEGPPICNLMNNQPQIGRQLRMKVINWLYEIVNKWKIEDKNLVFQAVDLMDTVYKYQIPNQPQSDLQLTAASCFYMVQQHVSVYSFPFEQLETGICYNKFTQD